MIKLFNHQLLALNYLRFNDSFMLFMEQGTGKTIPTLWRIQELLQLGEAKNCLIVCPKSVIGSWERDIEKFTAKQQAVLKQATIINYDKVWRDKTYNKPWDIIVLDEAHSIKNRASRRASFLLQLSVNAKFRYLLTGTPVSNGQLENLWSLICFLEPYKNGRSICSKIFARVDGGRGTYNEWIEKYATLDKYFKPFKYHDIKHLQEIVSSYSFRVKKSQCLDLPSKLLDEIIELELPCKKVYNAIAKESAIVELDFIADNPLVRLTKLRQLCSGFFILKDKVLEYPSEKVEALEDFLDGYDGKLVIFAEFKRSISLISEVLTKRSIKHVILDGEQKNKNIWRDFQNDISIKVIVCQYLTACQGIDLYASDTMLFFEPTLRSNVLEQAKDRIHRQGQKRACSYIHFITKGSIERAIYNALAGYSDFNEQLFTKYLNTYTRSKR